MPHKNLLLLGASSRVGRLVRGHWEQSSAKSELTYQYRDGVASADRLIWSVLDGNERFSEHVRVFGAPTALVSLLGVTSSSELTGSLNARLAKETLCAASEAGIGRVLLASSSAVYGSRISGEPFTETDAPQPASPYGVSKLEMEAEADTWRQRGLEVCSLRMGNVGGADMLFGNARRATADAPLRLDKFEDGTGPLRSYIGPSALARIIEDLAYYQGDLPPVLNLAGTPLLMEDVVEAMGTTWVWQTAPAGARQTITLDTSLLESLIGETHLAQTARSLVDQVRDCGGLN